MKVWFFIMPNGIVDPCNCTNVTRKGSLVGERSHVL